MSAYQLAQNEIIFGPQKFSSITGFQSGWKSDTFGLQNKSNSNPFNMLPLPFGVAPPPPDVLLAALQANHQKANEIPSSVPNTFHPNPLLLKPYQSPMQPVIEETTGTNENYATVALNRASVLQQFWYNLYTLLKRDQPKQTAFIATHTPSSSTSEENLAMQNKARQSASNGFDFTFPCEQVSIKNNWMPPIATKPDWAKLQSPALRIFDQSDPRVTVCQLPGHDRIGAFCSRNIHTDTFFGPWPISTEQPCVSSRNPLGSPIDNLYVTHGEVIKPSVRWMKHVMTDRKSLSNEKIVGTYPGSRANLTWIVTRNRGQIDTGYPIVSTDLEGSFLSRREQCFLMFRSLRPIQPGEELVLDQPNPLHILHDSTLSHIAPTTFCPIGTFERRFHANGITPSSSTNRNPSEAHGLNNLMVHPINTAAPSRASLACHRPSEVNNSSTLPKGYCSEMIKSPTTISDDSNSFHLRSNVENSNKEPREVKCHSNQSSWSASPPWGKALSHGSDIQQQGVSLSLSKSTHQSGVEEVSEGYSCEYCGKMFAYQYYRDKHLKYTRCVDQGNRKYPCKLCSRSFEKRDRLRIHVLHVHEKYRPHKCHLCDKSFSQSSSLNKHLRVHSGERPYKCSYCSKAFTASSILRTHIRQHSGEKPFKCKFCWKPFASHAAHDSHVRRTHGGQGLLSTSLRTSVDEDQVILMDSMT